MTERSEHNRPQVIRSPRFSIRWSAELLWSFVSQRITLRYKESLLGFGWIFLQPVALTIIFSYIRRIANIPTGEIPYPLFVAIGLVGWSFTALAISQSVPSISNYSALLKRTAFPRIVLPLSSIIATLADFGIMLFLVLALCLYTHHLSVWGLFWIPILLLIHFMLLIGIGCLVSLINVFLRDVGHATPHLLQFWFFASPVFYPFSMVPKEFKELSRWNPMTGLLEGYRSVLVYGQPPPLDLFLPAFLVAVATCALGLSCFWHLEGSVADML